MTTDITELSPAMKAAAKKYRLTLEAYRNNPRDYDTVVAWYEATSEFMELVDNDELNIISGLVEALEKAQRANAAQDDHINQQQDRIEQLEKGNQYAGKRIAELEIESAVKDASSLELKQQYQRLLESRTVKLPPKIERNDADGWFVHKGGRVGGCAAEWYNKALDDVGAELTGAGIKWEAE